MQEMLVDAQDPAQARSRLRQVPLTEFAAGTPLRLLMLTDGATARGAGTSDADAVVRAARLAGHQVVAHELPSTASSLGAHVKAVASLARVQRPHAVVFLGLQADVCAAVRDGLGNVLPPGCLELLGEPVMSRRDGRPFGLRFSHAGRTVRLHEPIAPAVDLSCLLTHVSVVDLLRHDVLVVGDGPEAARVAAAAVALGVDAVVAGPAERAGRRRLAAGRGAAVHVLSDPVPRGDDLAFSLAAGAVAVTASSGVWADVVRPGVHVLAAVSDQQAEVAVAAVHALHAADPVLRDLRLSGLGLVHDRLAYERQWDRMFDSLLHSSRRGVHEDLQRWRDLVAEDPTRDSPEVFVCGWYGHGNVGDELLLASLTQALTAAGARPSVLTDRPLEVAAEHGLPAVDRRDPHTVEAVLRRSASGVLGGGGLLHDYAFATAGGIAGSFARPRQSPTSYVPMMVTADVMGRPVHVHGIGLGPLDDADALRTAGAVLRAAASVSVRDPESQRLAVAAGASPPTLAPDPVYGLALAGPEAVRPPRVGDRSVLVNLRPWPGASTEVRHALVATLRTIAEAGYDLVGLPFYDADTVATRQALATATGRNEVRVLDLTADADQLVSDLRASRGLVAMRLHACLLAHRAGTAVVGLSYDAKVRAHFAGLGRDRWVCDLDDSLPTALPAAVGRLLTGDGRLDPATEALVRTAEDAAAAALRKLAQDCTAAPAPQEWEPVRESS